jgi:hypothetical protein
MQIKGRNWMVALQMYPYYWEKEVRWDSHSDPSASAVFGYNPLDLIFLTGVFYLIGGGASFTNNATKNTAWAFRSCTKE